MAFMGKWPLDGMAANMRLTVHVFENTRWFTIFHTVLPAAQRQQYQSQTFMEYQQYLETKINIIENNVGFEQRCISARGVHTRCALGVLNSMRLITYMYNVKSIWQCIFIQQSNKLNRLVVQILVQSYLAKHLANCSKLCG